MEIQEFDDLLSFGKMTSTVVVGQSEIVIKTLSSLEYSRISSRFKDKDSTEAARFEHMQREIVAASIESINGKKLSHEDKVRLLGLGQLGLVNMLFESYNELAEEQSKILEDAKKNSSQKTASLK